MIERDVDDHHGGLVLSRPVTVRDGRAEISAVLFERAESGGGLWHGARTVRMCVRYEVPLGSGPVDVGVRGEPCPPDAPEESMRTGRADTTIPYDP